MWAFNQLNLVFEVAMSVLQGNAKKYNGDSIDYVLIFDWATGECIGKAVPDSAGVWTFDYFTDLLCGITYVADGCEPITHGAYAFVAADVVYGYLALVVASTTYDAMYDKTAVSHPDWANNFEKVLELGLHNYQHNAGTAIATSKTKIVDIFDINWQLEAFGYVGHRATDEASLTLELLDENLAVLAAIKIASVGNYRNTAVWYGSTLNSLVRVPFSGSYDYGVVQGVLSFKNNAIYYTNTWTNGGTWTPSFEFAADISRSVKLRVTSSAKSTSSTVNGASAYLKILPPKSVQ